MEYVLHGYVRRIGTLQRCIQNVYEIYPPERLDIPSRNECVDLAINLQAFIFNVFGCIDNLAWIWVTEAKVKNRKGHLLSPIEVSFQNELVKQTLPSDFREYLDGLKPWIRGMGGFRHALAHRIPLYAVPYTISPSDEQKYREIENDKIVAFQNGDIKRYDQLTSEQLELARFTPAITHSHNEKSGLVNFHYQVLADWNTIIELSDKFLPILLARSQTNQAKT